MTLDQLTPGAEAVITAIELEKAQVFRLADFGMVPGTRVRCRCRSQKGAILALELRGTTLALRRSILCRIRGSRVVLP